MMVVLGVASVTSGCMTADKDGTYRPGWLPANSSSASVTQNPTSTLTYVTVATPYPTTIAIVTGLPTPTFRNPPTTNKPIVDNYTEIYNQVLYFNWNATALEYEVNSPPLVIEYTVTPALVTRTHYVTSDYGKRETKMVTSTTPDEQSWFEISIRDETGNILEQQGYGMPYDTWETTPLTIRTPGRYHIELKGGKDVKVNLVMRVGNS